MAMNELADRPLRVADEIILLHWWRLARWFMNLRAVPRWRESSARFLTRIYRRYFHDGLTRPGKILAVCSLLIFLFSYQTNSELLLITAAFGMALLLWSIVLGFVYRPKVTIERNTPEYGVIGKAVYSPVMVTNTSSRSLYNFSIREQVIPFGIWPKEWRRPYQTVLGTLHSTSMPVEFIPTKRGVMELTGLTVQSYFPFFLTRFNQRIPCPATVYVLPETFPANIPSLRHIADVASKKLALGTNNSRKGPSLEYAYSRPYQTGDSLRRLDHRASSRQGKPMSKIFEGADEIRRDQVYLIVDLTLQDFQRWQRRPRSTAVLDARLALAVEIGLSAQNEGFSLSAVACGNQWQEIDSVAQFYQQIATAQPLRAGTAGTDAMPHTVLSDSGVHLLVLGRWSDHARALVERWQQAGALVLVFLLAETPEYAGTLPVGSQFIEIAHGSALHTLPKPKATS